MNRPTNLHHRAGWRGSVALAAAALVLAVPAGRALADNGQDHRDQRVERRAGPERPEARGQVRPAVPHGPVVQQRGPLIEHRGPAVINRGPVIQQHGPVIVNRGPVVENRGPAFQSHAPVRFENHGPRDFRSHPMDRDHDYFDDRYEHARYYPRRGVVVRVLPHDYHPFYFHRRPYFFVGGVWYANGPGGYIVTAPPFGLTLNVLPPFYTTVWFGGVPYYYADDVYYRWNPGLSAYMVVEPPTESAAAETDQTAVAPDQNAETQLYIYPSNGQTQEQQDQDRYECYSWARNQTGFDPTQPGGGVAPEQNANKSQEYRRAMTACLTARGYSVN